jgi:hypothetical protein
MKSLRRLSTCLWILTLCGLVVAQLWSGAAFARERIDPIFLDKLAGLSPNEEIHFWVEFVDRPWKNDSPQIRQAYLDAHRQLPPVDMSYVSAVEALGVENETISELTNEASYLGPVSAVNSIAMLPFVSYVSEVQQGYPTGFMAQGSDRPAGPWLGGGGEGKMPATSDNHTCPRDHRRQLLYDNGSPMVAVDLHDLHNDGRNGSGILIGICDSGIKEDNDGSNKHNVFTGNVSGGGAKIASQKDFPRNDNFANDELGHGTAVAGLCAGFWWHASEDWGYIGAAPDAQLAIAKFSYYDTTNNVERWPDSYACDAIEWCVATAAVDIINLSAGWTYASGHNGYTRIARWLDWATKQGVACFTSMGNDTLNSPPPYRGLRSPADNFNAVSAAASDPVGTAIAFYSRRGPAADGRFKPDITAPGGVTDPDHPNNPDSASYWNEDSMMACPHRGGVNRYAFYWGTSFASPMAAGAAACIMEDVNALIGDPLALRMRLWEKATDKGSNGPDTTWGFGLMQANPAASGCNGYADLMIRDAAQNEGNKTTDDGYLVSCDVGDKPEKQGNTNGVGIYEGYNKGDDRTWLSPDIFVDNDPPFGEPDYTNQPRAGKRNHFKVVVNNIGDAMGNARVKLYRSSINVGSGQWTQIGQSETYVFPDQPEMVDIVWDTPPLSELGDRHWCLAATVEDITAGRRADKASVPGQSPWGARPPWCHHKCDNQASRNFNVYGSSSSFICPFIVENTTESSTTVSLSTASLLPQGWNWSLSANQYQLNPGESEVCSLTVTPSDNSPFGLKAPIDVDATAASGEFLGGMGVMASKGWGEHVNDCDLSDWTISTSGTGVFEATTSHYVTSPCAIHMRSQGDSHAYGVSPEVDFDLSQDYVISTNFMIPNTSNHWFVVLDNRHLHVVIDYYNELETWDGSVHGTVGNLDTGVWYEIICYVSPSAGSYDVHLGECGQGATYRVTSDFLHPDGNRTVRIGDIHGGGTDHGEGYWDDLTISGEMPPFPVAVACTTDVDPIIIPPGGGSFGYRVYLTNNSTERQTFKAWIKAILPDNTEYHVYGPKNVSLRGGQSVRVHRNQNVPGFAPTGIYYYSLRIGSTYPYQQDETGFYFTKEEGIAPATVGDWNVWETYEKAVAEANLPSEFGLLQNHPNPFNSKTVIRYQLPVKSNVKLEVYNLLGQKVAILADGEEKPGYKSVVWDCTEVASGMYFYKLSAGDFTETRRMMLVK